jgi:dTDP-4-dehydrorhamnose reductase
VKLLLTGKNSQLGFELQRALAVLGEVVSINSDDCDLADEAAIRRVLRDVRPNVIVNPAAYTAVDRAESEQALAQAINARAPAVLAEEARGLGALLIHYSTDYVFDGSKDSAYLETDAPNPTSVYGATKLAGEQAVAATCPRYLILRTSWVVGVHGGNFAKTMLRLACEREDLSVVADQFGAPTSAALLADVSAHLVCQAQREADAFPYGLYHSVAGGETNWHAYACYVIERARAAGKPVRVAPGSILAIASADYPTPARRPANSRLDTRLLRTTFGLHLPDWKAGVSHMLDQIL